MAKEYFGFGTTPPFEIPLPTRAKDEVMTTRGDWAYVEMRARHQAHNLLIEATRGYSAKDLADITGYSEESVAAALASPSNVSLTMLARIVYAGCGMHLDFKATTGKENKKSAASPEASG